MNKCQYVNAGSTATALAGIRRPPSHTSKNVRYLRKKNSNKSKTVTTPSGVNAKERKKSRSYQRRQCGLTKYDLAHVGNYGESFDSKRWKRQCS